MVQQLAMLLPEGLTPAMEDVITKAPVGGQ